MTKRWICLVLAGSVLGASCAKDTDTASTPPATPKGTSTDARVVLQQNRDAMLALNSYRAECLTVLSYDDPTKSLSVQLSRISAEKPTKLRYDMWTQRVKKGESTEIPTPGKADITFACDGTEYFKQIGDHYRKDSHVQPENLSTIMEPWQGFYSEQGSILSLVTDGMAKGAQGDFKYDGEEKYDGVDCQKVRVHQAAKFQGKTIDEVDVFYFGKEDHLARRCLAHIKYDGEPDFTRDAVIRKIETNKPIDAATYAYKPPKGVALQVEQQQLPLLSAGTPAPNFTVKDGDGKDVTLASLKGKVVVVDFWASWCGPCQESMPHTQQVAKAMADKGVPVEIVAIDDGEPRAAFESWLKENRSKYPNLHFAHIDPSMGLSGRDFHVTGIPTQYVIDKAGMIHASFVGYGGPTDDLQNAILQANG